MDCRVSLPWDICLWLSWEPWDSISIFSPLGFKVIKPCICIVTMAPRLGWLSVRAFPTSHPLLYVKIVLLSGAGEEGMAGHGKSQWMEMNRLGTLIRGHHAQLIWFTLFLIADFLWAAQSIHRSLSSEAQSWGSFLAEMEKQYLS